MRSRDEWEALQLRCTSGHLRRALRRQRVTRWDAFRAFDTDDTDSLRVEELLGAMRYLGTPGLSLDDACAVFEAADADNDGEMSFKDFAKLLTLDLNEDEEEEQGAAGGGGRCPRAPPRRSGRRSRSSKPIDGGDYPRAHAVQRRTRGRPARGGGGAAAGGLQRGAGHAAATPTSWRRSAAGSAVARILGAGGAGAAGARASDAVAAGGQKCRGRAAGCSALPLHGPARGRRVQLPLRCEALPSPKERRSVRRRRGRRMRCIVA